ncbi:DUF3108 domain-containing protein [Hoeflea sp. G2-23]|uniref:DUF3108 domain-containing protein n=1 Tax=Hoeflea algicola TaxID=2983763 RepID=A0ABT3ZAN1_9HYPH|nr:DUF3108 domain-containing protein [Hoeflea algicola]MCY0148713.1 DUF3108 domain-containing protein [Hoeflea algicola]
MTRLRGVFCIGMLALAPYMALQPTAIAEPVQVFTDYSVSLIGLPVAYLSFKTEIDGASYQISGSLRTSALSDIVSKTRGNASVSGRFGKDRLRASRFSVAYSTDAKDHRTEVRFNNGNVSSATSTPKRKRTAADWVPVSADDMRAVLDPLSGLVFPAGARVCPSSLPIFDGESRVTLHLAEKGVRPFRTKGFVGDAIVCAVRFEPKAGYRKGSSTIRYLQKLTSMEVWFAKHEEGGFYAPVYAKVPTKIGQVVVAATRFGG